MTTQEHFSYLTLHEAAVTLNVPTAWLRREALASRVPFLRAGRRLLFDLDAVRAELKRRAEDARGGNR